MKLLTSLSVLTLLLSGCVSTGSLGIITKSSLDPASALKNGRSLKEMGPAEAEGCRYFLLAIFPWGKSDLQTVVDKALSKTGGDALVNVVTSTSLYGFIPIYNVFTYTCTTVKGTAVKFENEPQKASGDKTINPDSIKG